MCCCTTLTHHLPRGSGGRQPEQLIIATGIKGDLVPGEHHIKTANNPKEGKKLRTHTQGQPALGLGATLAIHLVY